MIRVLLVDDESFFISSLQLYIDWAALDCEVVGIASDGLAALKMAETLDPDLIFLDIQMPRMDGIEVLRRLKERASTARVIMLTGFNQFEYAIAALRLGAVDYIYKAEMVPETFREVVRTQGKQARAVSHQASLPPDPGESAEEFIRQSINGLEIPDSHARESLCAKPRNLYLITLTIADYQAVKRRYGDKRQLLYNGILNTLQEIRRSEQELDVLLYDKHTFCLLKSFSEESSAQVIQRELDYLVRKCIAQLYRFFNLRLYAGISSGHSGYAGLSKAYEEAYSSGLLEFSLQSNVGHHNGQRSTIEVIEYLPMDETLYAFRQGLAAKDKNACLDALKKCLFWDDRTKALTPAAAKGAMSNIVYMVLNDDAQRENHIRRIEESANVRDLIDVMEGIIPILMEYWQMSDSGSCSQMVKSAMMQIYQHYADPALSLDSVAARIGASASYLSRLFKREVNLSFTQYLNHRRVSIALDLLRQDSSKMIYQIADDVGYRSVEHFNRVFKQITGKSPKDCRKQADD